MTDPDDDVDGVVTDTITIRRILTSDGDDVVCVDPDGTSGLTAHLGMLRLAEHTLIDLAMTDDEEDLT